jgi:hypothetical protein
MSRNDYRELKIYYTTVFVRREYDEHMFACDMMEGKKKVRKWVNLFCRGILSESDGDSLGASVPSGQFL